MSVRLSEASGSGRRRSLLSVAAAMIAIALAYGYALSRDVPTGSVRGKVIMTENGRPLSDALVTFVPQEDKGDEYRVRRAESGKDGQFSLPHLAAGMYLVSASTKAHGVESAVLVVEEGRTSEITLPLARTQPELALPQHQRVFATSEEVRIPVRGYVSGSGPEDALNVRMFRTRLSTIVRSPEGERALDEMEPEYSYDNTFTGKPIPSALLAPAGREAPRTFLSREEPIHEADREGFYYKRLRFGQLQPGLYLTEIAHGERRTSTWILVTNTALVTKQAGGRMLAYAVEMTKGTPLAGAAIRTYVDGRAVASGTTDEGGLARMDMPDARGEARRVIVATRGEDEAIVRNAGGYFGESMGRYRVYAYTDRPIYRPGQLIHYKAIVRRADDPGIRYSVPAGKSVQLELRDPEGDRIKIEARTTNGFGSVAGQAALSSEARTGVYTLITDVDGEKHTQDFVVASYRKPEFEVKVEPSRPRYVKGDTVEMTVSAEYYFGTPVAGAKATWYVYSNTDWSAEYPDEYEYEESEPGAYEAYRYYRQDEYLGSEQSSGTVRLDEQGRAVIRIPTKAEGGADVPQASILTLSVTVTDEASREVSGQADARLHTGDVRLTITPEGYVAQPNQPSSVTLLARDLEGRPVAGLPIQVEGAFTTWANNDRKDHIFQTLTVTTGEDGRVPASITPPKTGEVRITASAADRGGRKVYAHASLWSAGDGESELDTEYGDLSILTDKRRYSGGDVARVMLNTSRVGQNVLLTVEGDRLYDVYQTPIRSKSSVLRIPIKAEYGPNVLLAACYVKEKHIAQSEAVLRVSQPEKDIRVEIRADRSPAAISGKAGEPGKPRYAPRDRITYHLKTADSKGRPVSAELSFGVVDESIYALREDDPEALREAFYPRRTNSVATAYSFAVEYLGNASKAEPKITSRKKFPDTAFWDPFVRTDAGGTASVSFELPDTLTTWRATATAQTLSTKVGRATQQILTAKDFFVRVEAPRFLTQRDASQVTAIVHNNTGADQTVLLHLRARGVTVGAGAEQTLSVGAGKTGQFVWPVTAAAIDQAVFDVAAWTPRTAGAVQHTDRVEISIPVRPHGRERYEQYAGALQGGREEVETIRLEDEAIVGASRLKLRVTDSVRGAIAGALPYLIGYPYGCTEQTMSRILPDILAKRALGLSIPAGEGGGDLDDMVRDGLARLSRMQQPNGAWGWWEYDAGDPWMTAYVIYGLGMARAQGIEIGPRLQGRAVEGGKAMLLKVSNRDKPFLLYAMALLDPGEGRRTAGIVETQLKPARESTAGLAYIVMLRKLLGRDPTAALAELDRRAVREEGTIHWPADGTEYSGWSERMNTATALRALLTVDRNHPGIRPALHWLMVRRTGDYWEDTRDTSWVVTTLIDYAAAFPEASNQPSSVQVSVNGRAVGPDGVWTGGGARDRVLTIPASYLQPGKNDVRIVRSGGGEAFYSLELRQYLGQEGMAAENASGITITREYLRLVPKRAGGDYWTVQAEPTNNIMKRGDRIRVRLKLKLARELEYMMVEDPFPSGCEATERGTVDDGGWSYWYSSMDVRDDCIAFFARRMSAGEHVIEYNLRAQTPGAFHTLPAFAQPMYAPSVRGESAEARVEIR